VPVEENRSWLCYMSLSLQLTMMPESPKTCPLSTSVLQRWKSDGSGSFPVNDRNDDGSFPCYINAYSREDDAVLERWKSNGSFSFDDWNDDGSFPGNINEYARGDDVISVLERWKSDGSFSFDDWNDDGSFPGNINEYARGNNVIPRKSISIAPVLRKIRSLQWRRSQSLQSKKAGSLQPRRWRNLYRSRSDSNKRWDDDIAVFFEEMPLLGWIELG
jgi:hypothetical protein